MVDFQSESYKNFLIAHTRLNNYTKILTIAVDFLSESKDTDENLSILINELILKSGERWTPRVIKNSKTELLSLKNDLIKSAIMWVYSSFEIYLNQTQGVLSSYYLADSGEKRQINDDLEEDEKSHKVIEVYKKLDWEIINIENSLAIINFYEELRHIIVHNLGVPSQKLNKISKSDDFDDAIKNWKTKFPKKTISPPPIVIDNFIELKPHHSILYSDACLRVARDMNERLYGKLGLNHFIERTISKHLLNVSKLTSPKCIDLSRYIAYHLRHDFNIKLENYDVVYKTYTDSEILKQHKKRYNTLKNNR